MHNEKNYYGWLETELWRNPKLHALSIGHLDDDFRAWLEHFEGGFRCLEVGGFLHRNSELSTENFWVVSPDLMDPLHTDWRSVATVCGNDTSEPGSR